MSTKKILDTSFNLDTYIAKVMKKHLFGGGVMEWIVVGIVVALIYVVLEIRHIKKVFNENVSTQELINFVNESATKILAESINTLKDDLKCD